MHESLPPALVEALNKIGDQIQLKIFEPLLIAPSISDLTRSFESLFPKFRDYYVSTVLLLVGSQADKASRFSDLTISSFRESERILSSSGPFWIGRDSSQDALQGLAAMTRVVKAAAKAAQNPEAAASLEKARLENWSNSIVAYMLTFSVVLFSAFRSQLPGGGTPDRFQAGKHSRVGFLEQSLRRSRLHHLDVARNPSASSAGTACWAKRDEDVLLADTGLQEYASALHREDLP